MTESALLAAIRLHLSRGSIRLLRNNIGALQDATGRWVHYGVANPGGSDLIGWQTIYLAGQPFARFVAIECKVGRRKATDEQAAFIAAVQAAGGVAGVVRSVAEAEELLNVG